MQCEICKALANPLRMAIVNRLDDREIAAADLIADLGISKANLSKHMALLIHGGIAESRRDGRQNILSPDRSGNPQGLRNHEFRSVPPVEAGRQTGIRDRYRQGFLIHWKNSNLLQW